MKINCDIVLTIDNFEEKYSSWKGRVMTVMGEYIKVSRNGLTPRYFDAIYLFEELGLMIGFSYDKKMPECYISTENGLETEPLVDAYPFLFEYNGHLYATAKKYYKSSKYYKYVIGIGIIDVSTLTSLDSSEEWPIWEEIVSMNNGAIIVKKKDNSYGLCTIDKFPECNLIDKASSIVKHMYMDDVYIVKKMNGESFTIDFSRKLSKLKF